MITVLTSNFYYGFLSGIVFTIIVIVVAILWIERQVIKEKNSIDEPNYIDYKLTDSGLTGSATVDQSVLQKSNFHANKNPF